MVKRDNTLDVALASIGDAVIITDEEGHVGFLNPVAESLTGWSTDEAEGRPLERVFHIVNERTRAPANDPVARVLQTGVAQGLSNHTVLRYATETGHIQRWPCELHRFHRGIYLLGGSSASTSGNDQPSAVGNSKSLTRSIDGPAPSGGLDASRVQRYFESRECRLVTRCGAYDASVRLTSRTLSAGLDWIRPNKVQTPVRSAHSRVMD